jgi:hypothetical protein
MIERVQGKGVNMWRSARNVVHRKANVNPAKNALNTLPIHYFFKKTQAEPLLELFIFHK